MKRKGIEIISKNYIFIVVSLFIALGFLIILGVDTANSAIREIGDHVYAGEIRVKMSDTDDDYQEISGYTGLNWSQMQEIMKTNKGRLLREYAQDWNSGGSFSNINPRNKPEGQVWKHDGDLIIDDTAVSGKGTIIVEGNMNINGNIRYESTSQRNSVGFIVNGKITINSNVENLVGAYYASEEIEFR